MEFNLPEDCPFVIRQLHLVQGLSTYYLIREHDDYGEFPNIYAKLCRLSDTPSSTVVVLSDTGTGKDIESTQQREEEQKIERQSLSEDAFVSHGSSHRRWNLASVLSCTINPLHRFPYIVITTHCHYDHIMGIRSLLRSHAKTTVMSSSYQKSYLRPWQALQQHSLCDLYRLKAPHYPIKWLSDGQMVSYGPETTSMSGADRDLGITIFHTPGHTPDSLTWYDHEANLLSVGDTFYERESDDTRRGSGKWATEPPQPVIFNHDSNLRDWMKNMDFLIDFVRKENKRREPEQVKSNMLSSCVQDGVGNPLVCHIDEIAVSSESEDNWLLLSTNPASSSGRVQLCAAHVTVSADALNCLLEMKQFMMRVLKDEVPKKRVKDVEKKGEVWLWDDCLEEEIVPGIPIQNAECRCRFSLQAPIDVVDKGKNEISTWRGMTSAKSG